MKNAVGFSICLGLVAAALSLAGEPVMPDTQSRGSSKLAALADNTWVNLNLPWRGGGECGPFVYIPKHHLAWKYGGCCDNTPPVKISFPKGSARYPNGYSNTCWAMDTLALQWRMLRDYDASWPKDRPANGCSRGYCYDSKRGVVWMYGCASDGGSDIDGNTLWNYDPEKDKFAQVASPPPPKTIGRTMVHDPFGDLIVFASGETTWVFHCDTQKWEGRKTPGAPGAGSYNAVAFDVENKKVVLPLAQPTGKTAPDKQADTRTTFWKQNGPKTNGKRTFQEHAFATWTYDSAANKWEKLDLKPEDSPAVRFRHGVAYDSLNKVVLLVSGSTETWDEQEKQFSDVWVLDVKAAKWTEMKPAGDDPKVPARDNRQFCYDSDQNVFIFQPAKGSVYAYRYKNAAAKQP